MTKRSLAAAVLLTAVIALPAVRARAASPRRVRLVAPSAHLKVLNDALERFGRDVSQATKGELSVELVAQQARSLAAQVAEGDVEMGQIFTSELAAYNPAIQAIELPFAFHDYGQALAFLDGPAGQGLLASLAPHNLRGIAFTFSGGFKMIPTSGRELRRLEDFKGLKLRVYPGDVASATARAWGEVALSKPQPPGVEESLALMKKGEIDGAEMTYPVLGSLCEGRKVAVLNDTYHSLRATALVINEKFFQSLTPAQREAVSKAAVEAAKAERLASIAEAESMRRYCVAQGVTVVTLAPAEGARLAEAAAPVYERFKAEYGAELVGSILAQRSSRRTGPSR